MSKPFLLSISGGGGWYPYALGAASRLRSEFGSPPHYAGVSSGCIVALLLALEHHFTPQNYQEQIWRLWNEGFERSEGGYHPTLTHLHAGAQAFLRRLLHRNPEAYLHLSGRLFIGITTYTQLRTEFTVISNFTSNEDIVQAILASCTIFPFAPFPFTRYRGQWANDGFHMHNYVTLESHVNYVVRYPLLFSGQGVVQKTGFGGGADRGAPGWLDFLPTCHLPTYHRLITAGWNRTHAMLTRAGPHIFVLEHRRRTPNLVRLVRTMCRMALLVMMLWWLWLCRRRLNLSITRLAFMSAAWYGRRRS